MSAVALPEAGRLVDRLLRAGARVDVQDTSGQTALMKAALMKATALSPSEPLRLLLAAGADESLRDHAGHDAFWHYWQAVTQRTRTLRFRSPIAWFRATVPAFLASLPAGEPTALLADDAPGEMIELGGFVFDGPPAMALGFFHRPAIAQSGDLGTPTHRTWSEEIGEHEIRLFAVVPRDPTRRPLGGIEGGHVLLAASGPPSAETELRWLLRGVAASLEDEEPWGLRDRWKLAEREITRWGGSTKSTRHRLWRYIVKPIISLIILASWLFVAFMGKGRK